MSRSSMTAEHVFRKRAGQKVGPERRFKFNCVFDGKGHGCLGCLNRLFAINRIRTQLCQ